MKILAVGCGRRKREEGVVLLDIVDDLKPDVVWNLDQTPYPFEGNTFDGIECFDVIEHLDNLLTVLEEFHRVLKPGGWLKLTTPHFSCANSFIDPTHRHHLSYFSFDYFSNEHGLSFYSKARFRIAAREIYFAGGGLKRRLFAPWANRHPAVYEQKWAWIFPAWFLSFELHAVK